MIASLELNSCLQYLSAGIEPSCQAMQVILYIIRSQDKVDHKSVYVIRVSFTSLRYNTVILVFAFAVTPTHWLWD